MKNFSEQKHRTRVKRAFRVRKRLQGTKEKPRLSVFKSNKHLSLQLIDDEQGVTLGSIATYSKQFRGTEFAKKNKETAKHLGAAIAEIALKQNIQEVVFDRGHSKYHGILASLADAAREKGLKF